MHTQGWPYPMPLLNVKPQSFFIEDMDRFKTCDKYYITSDTYVSFLFWQATKSGKFPDQALQDIA